MVECLLVGFGLGTIVFKLIAVPIGNALARIIQRRAWFASMLRVANKASISCAGLCAVVMCLPENVTRIE